MEKRDHARLLAELSDAYARHSPKSAALQERARQSLVDGLSHSRRMVQPFPPRITDAKGAYVRDEDGHDILDFWQGHYACILGHNPKAITRALAPAMERGWGLQTGFADRTQVEAAELLCRQTGAERARFTTSGALGTMYAVILARAFTGRGLVVKVGGGWHGSQPWALKGIGFRNGSGFTAMESQGLPAGLDQEIVVTRFNDPDRLRDDFCKHGDRAACFIVEPFIGAGGFIPATGEYLRTARELTHRHGALLIFDEVISGFRFRAGDMGALYGVRPDLAVFGKVMGGGMPVAAVAGRADVMGLAGHGAAFTGGTYSGHPASTLAAKTMMEYLIAHQAEMYPRLAVLGERTRQTVETAFAEEGIYARCTGYPNDALPGSSMTMCHFPYDENRDLRTPEDVNDPAVCDVVLRDKALQQALLLENVHVVHGLGALSTAHTEADIARLGEACRRAARRIRPYV